MRGNRNKSLVSGALYVTMGHYKSGMITFSFSLSPRHGVTTVTRDCFKSINSTWRSSQTSCHPAQKYSHDGTYQRPQTSLFTFRISCTPEHMVEHVQVVRNVRTWLRSILFKVGLCFFPGHAIDEVSVAEVPADRVWLLCRFFQNLLHHCWPASVLFWHYHLVYVKNNDVLESE